MKTITFIGIGKLGLCSALCFEKGGHQIIGYDINSKYIKSLQEREFQSSEENVMELYSKSNILFTDDFKVASESEYFFIVVDTPTRCGKHYDTRNIESVLYKMNDMKLANKHIVICSTVLPSFCNLAEKMIPDCQNTTLSYNPEFIAQGTIIRNFLNPDMVLLGVQNKKTGFLLKDLYTSFIENLPTFAVMGLMEAEITKISLNGFLTTKIAYANMIGELCEKTGSNPEAVLSAIGADSRIGSRYFSFGEPFGGPCFPRDTRALCHTLNRYNVYNNIVSSTQKSNNRHTTYMANKKGNVIENITYKKGVPILDESPVLNQALYLSRTQDRRITLVDNQEIIDMVKQRYGNYFDYKIKVEKPRVKTAVVFGAGGFIGSHLVRRLKREGFYVIGADLKYPEFSETVADKFYITNLCYDNMFSTMIPEGCDELYQLAADMGGAMYVFSKENDANIMTNSVRINLNTCEWCVKKKVKKVFYSSSACAYAEHNQLDRDNPNCAEESAYPANPDSEYGWEKIFSERLYNAYMRNKGLNIRIARFHNITGEEGTWQGGREKAPAALCRKVATAIREGNDSIDIFGDGEQTRSFLHVNECLEGVRRLMDSDVSIPLNIGSNEMVSINTLANMIIEIAQPTKEIKINHISGPLGVRGRTSDNTLILEKLNWQPSQPLKETLTVLYKWVSEQVNEVSK